MSSRVFSFPPAVPPLPSWDGFVTPQQFGGGSAASAAQNLAAFQAANDYLEANGGGVLLVPPGTYDLPDHTTSLTPVQQQDTLFNLSSNVELRNNGVIDGAVLSVGQYIARTDTVVGVGSLSAGVQSFAGNFSAYAPGDIAVIELQGVGGAGNQFGVDFLTVATASASTLTTTETTRWPYDAWKISQCTAATKVTGSLARADFSLAGNFTALFSVGDWLRIENLDGTDTPFTPIGMAEIVPGDSKAYFEYVKVKAITSSLLTFEQNIAYDHTNFWLAKASPTSDVTIDGGYIKSVITEACEGITYSDIEGHEFGIRFNFDFRVERIYIETTGPFAARFSHSRGGVISDIQPRGSVSSTGNANLKFTSMLGVSIANVATDDVTSSSLGCFGVQTDFYYTPYASWMQECALTNIGSQKPKGSTLLSMYLTGTRNCLFNNLYGGAEIRFAIADATLASNILSRSRIDLENLVGGSQIHAFRAPFMNVEGMPNGYIGPGVLEGAAGNNSGRTLWIRGGTYVDNNDGLHLHGIKCLSETPADVFIYLADADGIFVNGCSDNAAITNSIEFGTPPTTSNTKLGVNNFNANQFVDASQTATIASGVATLTGQHIHLLNLAGEGGAADDLNTLNGGTMGQIVVICASDGAVTITVKDNIGNFRLEGDCALDSDNDTLTIMWNGTGWRELARSNNDA